MILKQLGGGKAPGAKGKVLLLFVQLHFALVLLVLSPWHLAFSRPHEF